MAEKLDVRRQTEWMPLTKTQFRERFYQKFYDPPGNRLLKWHKQTIPYLIADCNLTLDEA